VLEELIEQRKREREKESKKRSTYFVAGKAPIINVHLMASKLECNHNKRIQKTEQSKSNSANM